MKKLIILMFIIISIVFLFSCTDASRGKFKAIGSRAHVKCYSGGVVIYSGFSTGKVKSEVNSDGYFFVDEKTGKLMEVSGDYIITYGVK